MSASKLGFFSDELRYFGQDTPEQLQMKCQCAIFMLSNFDF